MRQRLIYGAGLVLLILSATLVIWQGSFSFGEYAPASPEQTSLYWAVSTLVFLLTVTLGFMLFRTAARLYVDRRSGREGSRIRTKLVIGALALSFIPVFFLVLWSVSVLNRNLDKWFSRPAVGVQKNIAGILAVMEREARGKAAAQAALLAALPEAKAALEGAGSIRRACTEHHIEAAALLRLDGTTVQSCGERTPLESAVRAPILDGGQPVGYTAVVVRLPAQLAEQQQQMIEYLREYDRLSIDRKDLRNFYLLLLAAISLFVLFVATWIALFLSKQISNPITALLEAAGQVRKGNLSYRVETKAADELASLVRAFNEMTRGLEANRWELENRRRFTEAILQSIPTGVISIAADGAVLKVNRALRQIFPEDKVGSAARLEDLFTRDDTAEIKYLMKRARRTGAAAGQLEMKSSRGTLHLSVTVAALEEKLTSGFVVLLEDTSELLRAQKLAAWQEVARRIAHEIKNPLTPIALCGERIARQIDRVTAPPDTSRILHECTATIAHEVESVKGLVNEFAQFAGFPTAQPVPSDLNEVIDTALGVFAGRLDGIEILRELAPGLPQVNIDREQFKRVVVNLVDNAAESMQESLLRRLFISTQLTAAETIELTVADTGCGISPDDKDRLFLPYFSTKGRGTGLGLAIVSRILTEHNASIRVEDNQPQGARFIVEVPVLTGETEPSRERQGAAA